MSGRVCYLGRAGRGDALALVRLVGTGTDEAWEGPAPGDDPAEVSLRINDAAAWTAERAMRGDGPRGEISLLCVDVEAGVCAWLTAPSGDQSVVVAALAQGGEGGGAPATGTWAPPSPAESSVQALVAPAVRGRRNGRAAAAGAQKLAVVTMPDVSARLFLDALDDRGVVVDRAVSLWHAMAMAWDPAGPGAGGGPRGGAVVATSAPVTGVVVVDPVGRLVWAWSRAGELLAAGTIRLAQERAGTEGGVVIGKPEVGRLAADWLGWSCQLGVAPARVVCVGPRTAEDGGSLSQQELGMTLGRLWPGATVDLAVHEDPIGATLRRLAGMEEETAAPADARLALVELSRRPGRAHRAVYRWASLAGLAAAAALGVVAWRSFSGAGAADGERSRVRAAMMEQASALAAPANDFDRETLRGRPAVYLEQKVQARRKASAQSSGLEPPKPILQELETLSMVLGSGAGLGVELDQVSLLSASVTLYVAVPDTKTGEAIHQALSEVAGSHVKWGLPSFAPGGTKHPGKQTVTFFGAWDTPAGAAP